MPVRYTSAVDLQPPAELDPARVDQRVILDRVPWAQYDSLVKWRGERASPRLSFNRGRLEIMSPSRWHDRLGRRIALLVQVYADHRGIVADASGSWTIRAEPKVGAEPDESFVFRDDLDATHPDLAIEVNWSRGGLNKLEIYRTLGVPEVWIWEDGAIHIFGLQSDGYTEASESRFLPGIDLIQLIRHLDATTSSAAMKAYREELRG